MLFIIAIVVEVIVLFVQRIVIIFVIAVIISICIIGQLTKQRKQKRYEETSGKEHSCTARAFAFQRFTGRH